MDPKSLKIGDVVWSSSICSDGGRPFGRIPIGEAKPWKGKVASEELDGWVMVEQIHSGKRYGVRVDEIADSELAAWDKILNEALRREEEAAKQARVVRANIRAAEQRKRELGW